MKRLQLDMQDESMKELDALVKQTGMKTRSQLFNVALSFYEWALRELSAGKIIASVDEVEQKYKEVEMPGFTQVRPRGRMEAIELLDRLGRYVETPKQQASYQALYTALSDGSGEQPHAAQAQDQEAKISRAMLGRQLRVAKK
jgi:hypothetical protein